MDVMNSPVKPSAKNSFLELLPRIQTDFPDVVFIASASFYWSGETRTVCYDADSQDAIWSLLHELGHMLQDHNTYKTDVRLVRMEVEAWESAKQLAERYGQAISDEHIEDCIDSYRNWQYLRSKCPVCAQSGVEKQSGRYHCINCLHDWRVTANRFCRVYRQNA